MTAVTEDDPMDARLSLRSVLLLVGAFGLLAVGLVWSLHAPNDNPTLTSNPAASSAAFETENGRSCLEPLSATQDVVPSQSRSAVREMLALHGSVVLIDDAGAEHPDESGTLLLDRLVGEQSVTTRVEVDHGKWQASVQRGDRVTFAEATLGGRRAYSGEYTDDSDLTTDGQSDLRLRWPSPLVLYARDAATNADLTQVEIIWKREWSSDDEDLFTFPRCAVRDGVITRTGSSPFRFPIDSFSGRSPEFGWLFVRAPGYAWAREWFECLTGGDVFVELAPSGNLDIEFSGAEPDASIVLRLVGRGEWRPLFEKPIGRLTQMSVEDLPVGAYTVTAVRGAITDEFPLVLARAEVDLVANSRTRVNLVLDPAPRLVRASQGGMLVIPRAWEAERPRIEAFLRGVAIEENTEHLMVRVDPVVHTPETDTYRWHLDQVQIGTYELMCWDPPLVAVVQVVEGGSSGVRIEVPNPAEVSFHAMDAITGEDLPMRLQWAPPYPEGASPAWSRLNDVPTSSQDLRCPVGEVLISASTEEQGYVSAFSTVPVHAGPNQITLRFVRHATVAMTLMDGYRELPLGDNRFEVVEAEGGGEVDGIIWEEGDMQVHLPRPGSYRVKLRAPRAGYVMPEDQIVNVNRGTTTEVVFRLVRKQ